MCQYCERRKDVKFGWDQPKLPYHNQKDISAVLTGNVLENEKWDGVIHDYQTCSPQLILTCPGYFNGDGVGAIYIPIKHCPECGRKLGKQSEPIVMETIENNAYLHSCKCPQCGNNISRGYDERIFFCEECGTKLHQRAFTDKELDNARFQDEMDEYED